MSQVRIPIIARSNMLGLSADGGGRSTRSTSPRAEQIAAVQDQPAVAVEDAGAGLGRRDQPAQHRRDAFRVDREIGILVGDAVALAGLEVEQAVGVDGDGIAFDRRRRRDRLRNDLGIDQQALRARLDQAGAELREVEDARDQRDEAGEIERDDAAGEARERQREEELSGAAQPAQRPLPAFFGRPCRRQRCRARAAPRRPRHCGPDQAAFDQAMANTAGCCGFTLDSAPRCILAEAGQSRQLTMPARALICLSMISAQTHAFVAGKTGFHFSGSCSRANQVSLKR